ncbi:MULTISPECIES: MBL fold metallo-hydrolase [Brucella/Ochrobactrum group]|uniref:MBL fold metallo-hydrolase n=1 Tax=Ochrobactrum soli TaxID=2448455 RepID=A0A849KKE1_9HYPH|nr:MULTISPECIES: MBL fold metallo-hydrolase [Brucella]MPR63572.1 MBL fold metallo-hydrolase [Brucella intermedia]NNU62265.1 MBL fold metallo-hydrolase [[Ochrobactrum] soli]
MSGFEQIPAIYHRPLGDMLVTTLCDGYVAYDTFDIFRDGDAARLEQFLTAETRIAPPVVSINAFLVQHESRVILIDCGSGDIMGPTCGRLPELLARLEIAPEAVTDVLLTHIHPDHSNGLTNPETGAKLFPRAVVHVHEAEIQHWFDDEAKARASERQKRVYFDAGRIQITPYLADSVHIFNAECKVLPGIAAVPSVGHTPGHSCYILRSRSEAMIIWGDTVHVPEVQLADPDVGMIFDTDTPAAALSRRRILQRCVDEDLLVGGMHIHFPGFARVRRGYQGEYRFIQEQWFHAKMHKPAEQTGGN